MNFRNCREKICPKHWKNILVLRLLHLFESDTSFRNFKFYSTKNPHFYTTINPQHSPQKQIPIQLFPTSHFPSYDSSSGKSCDFGKTLTRFHSMNYSRTRLCKTNSRAPLNSQQFSAHFCADFSNPWNFLISAAEFLLGRKRANARASLRPIASSRHKDLLARKLANNALLIASRGQGEILWQSDSGMKFRGKSRVFMYAHLFEVESDFVSIFVTRGKRISLWNDRLDGFC